ncbi:MAG: iron-containing alcohol dehydrogenase [Ruminiclostridium sp.]|jgi:alcohol dehydrogenase YqhD (iron-dependent ADH family)|nr:iron-containing alcohol dehydrogenase [Ruminiclostridium sp.]
MNRDFEFFNPTQVFFGKTAMDALPTALDMFGENVLLAYGGGSIKANGVYDQVMAALQRAGKRVTEFTGIMPNPTYAKVLEGGALARECEADLILAVGGGSVMDSAKAVAIAAVEDGDLWTKYWVEKRELDCMPIPVGAIVTMVGTGSEMDGDAVVTNEETMKKTSCWDYALYPKFAILNPEFTYSVPEYQMVSGIFDILSHIMEIYFSPEDEDNISDDFAEALMKSVIRNTAVALENPRDYTARSNLMWASTLALSGILSPSKREDWEAHQIEHQLGAYYDCAHGMGLAAVSPAYYRLICPYGLPKFKRFAVNVWGVDPTGKSDQAVALEGIDALAAFIRDSRMTPTLRALGITDDSKFQEIAESCNLRKGGYHTLTRQEIMQILRDSF